MDYRSCLPLILISLSPQLLFWSIVSTEQPNLFKPPQWFPIFLVVYPTTGFPGGAVVKNLPTNLWLTLVAQLVRNQRTMQKTWIWSLGWDDPLEKGKFTLSSILAWRISWTIESDKQLSTAQYMSNKINNILLICPSIMSLSCISLKFTLPLLHYSHTDLLTVIQTF